MTGEAILSFVEEVGTLKTIQRSGWGFRGIRNAESVADHCFRVTLFAMLLADILIDKGEDIRSDRVIRIALLHEVAEARIGDIPYPAQEYIPEEIKAKAEQEVIESMFDPFGKLKDYYIKLWKEFEYRTSIEGEIVQIADKMECMIQVSEYERLGYDGMEEFWQTEWNKRGFYHYDLTAEIMTILQKEHDQRVKNHDTRIEARWRHNHEDV